MYVTSHAGEVPKLPAIHTATATLVVRVPVRRAGPLQSPVAPCTPVQTRADGCRRATSKLGGSPHQTDPVCPPSGIQFDQIFMGEGRLVVKGCHDRCKMTPAEASPMHVCAARAGGRDRRCGHRDGAALPKWEQQLTTHGCTSCGMLRPCYPRSRSFGDLRALPFEAPLVAAVELRGRTVCRARAVQDVGPF